MKNLSYNPGTYNEGYTACQQFIGDSAMIQNPYVTGSTDFISWEAGWASALQILPVFAY
jgi:hypothetical protein